MKTVTVAICTWNRANLLDQTLTRMHELCVPANVEWELLIVNNNCSDETDEVIARHQGVLPIRRLFEPRPGLSNARNCASSAAQGKLVIFADDDVLVCNEWLCAYAEAAARWPDAGYFGGPIDPWYECPPPSWLLANIQHIKGMFALKDFGQEERPFGAGEVPFGANMAIRTQYLREMQFDPTLGRTEKNTLGGEETVMFNAVAARGITGVWVPGARLLHFVVKKRLTRQYLWAYHHGSGRTAVLQNRAQGVATVGKKCFGLPRWLLRQVVESSILAGWKQLGGRTDWVQDYVRLASGVGMLGELVRQMTVRCPATPTEKACDAPV